MKKFVLLSLVMLLTATGCSKGDAVDSLKEMGSYEYSDVRTLNIEYDEIFSYEGDYYVYIYRSTCEYCEAIKQQIIDFAIDRDDFYFLPDSDEITKKSGYDPSETIGATSLDELWIRGVPTLLTISNHVLVSNVAGGCLILGSLGIEEIL